MDLLEAQQKEIRSFLELAPLAVGSSASGSSAAGAAAPTATSAAAAGYSPGPGSGSGTGVGAGVGPLRPISHHHAVPSRSAPGDNSAHAHTSSHSHSHYYAHQLDLPPQIVSSPTATVATSSGKRRAEDDDYDVDGAGSGSAKQQRSKRNRYISIACNECKRRKIKCNGQTPCQRCGHLSLQCLYTPNCCSSSFKDSDEFRHMTDQVNDLQRQVTDLVENLNLLRQEQLRLAPIPPDRILPPPTITTSSSPSASSIPSLSMARSLHSFRVPPSFHGPTSMGFTVDVAKNTLHNMGYSGLGDSGEDGNGQREQTPQGSPSRDQAPSMEDTPFQRTRDPLWELDKDEMVRLCRVYEEEVGIMYPVVPIATVITHAKTLAAWMEAAGGNDLTPFHLQDDGVTESRTQLVKIIICCALTVEEHGNSSRASRLYETIQPQVDKTLMNDPADVSKLPFLALCAGYRFLSNDEILAWRMMGHVARLCLELGLHRREGFEKIADPDERRTALSTFWSVYMLDRRWSFSTGLPFVCHDDMIDPKLPYPEKQPYLLAMISYSKLAAKIWKLVDYFEPAVIRELKPKDFEDLDRQILDWYDSVPEEIRAVSIEDIPIPSAPAYDLGRLRIWTLLRLNQIRIWLYTPVLHSASSIEANQSLALTAVRLAKETIRFLTHLNNATNLYRRIQVFYHQFLTSAIAVLFLASTHAPVMFSASCRNEFYMALDLIKDMSGRSWVSQRLWRTVRSLKAYAPRLGMEEDRHSHEGSGLPVSMMLNGGGGGGGGGRASSSRSPVPGYGETPSRAGGGGRGASRGSMSTPSTAHVKLSPSEDQNNGLRLGSAMGNLYEGFLGAVGAGGASADMVPSRAGLTAMVSPDGGHYMGSPGISDGSVYQQLRDMF